MPSDGHRRALRDVKATVAAHTDRGDGRCAGWHGEFNLPDEEPATPPFHPCPIHWHFAQVEDQLRRQNRP